jgi:hexosaminidase
MTTLSSEPYESVTTLSIIACKDLRLTLTLACDGSASQLDFALENTLERGLDNWCLHLDLQREVTAGPDTRLSRVGSHLQLRPVSAGQLKPGETCTLQLRGAAQLLQRLSDLPSGCFLSAGEEVVPVQLVDHNLAPARDSDGDHAAPAPQGGAALLPAPRDITEPSGIRLWPETPAVFSIAEARPALDWLQSMLGRNWLNSDSSAVADLLCALDQGLAEEAYRLDINRHQVSLFASCQTGFNRGAATLLQLLESDPELQSLPCLQVHDAPRYSYRGLMLDCARHFHSVDTILGLLDLMALYKLNHFHWHLTDDEAWRLEILAFPQLTEIGAWRGHFETLPPQLGSGPGRYGGYYSREDVRRVVEHAARAGITVVPEIDIPGHCRACIQSLPHLLQEPGDGSRYLSVQFFNDNVLNPGLPGTYQFLDAVLEEVCELFPGPYIHLGADEVPEGVWTDSPACRALMQRHGYDDLRELQGHLLRQAQQFLAARGRHLVGWEEAAQGDKLQHDAPICAWTGDKAIVDLHAAGFPVISCPAPRAYLDLAWSDDPGEPGLHWAGTADLQAWYENPPFPPEIDGGLGVQANLWSELLTSREKLEYMLFPRVLATAEWGWYDNAGNDWPGFRSRVATQLEQLRKRGVSPRPLGLED